MSKETREHISCLVDGEISRETSQFLVRRLGSDEELRATWTRYHLVRDCLRHQQGDIAGADLSARISRALENEAPGRAPRRLPKRWLKPVAGLAIAASVALMAIVTVGPGASPAVNGTGGELANQDVTEPFVSPQIHGLALRSSQASLNGQLNADSRKINSYLVRHYQASDAAGGGRHFVTFVPIVFSQARVIEPDSKAERAETVGDSESTQR
jgi:sigma-E factor negative regulatory protein RseA